MILLNPEFQEEMKMLNDLRKHSKSIIFVTAILFIVGMALIGVTDIFFGRPPAVVINGKKISLEEYDAAFQNAINMQMSNNENAVLGEDEILDLHEKVLDEYKTRMILEKAIKDRDIEITDDEVAESILNNPSSMIRQSEIFMTDGRFDMAKYQQIIKDGALPSGEPLDLSGLEMLARQNLPFEKLYEEVKADVEVTDEDVKQEFIDQNRKADIEAIYFNYRDIEDVEVTAEEIEAYYNENKEDYLRDPVRKLDYVKIEMKPSDADEKIVLDRAQDILKRAKAGEDFAELARMYSEGPTGPKGGDLGYFTKDRMVKEFSDAAFSMKVGQVSDLVKSQFGYHIIKVMDKRKNDKGDQEVKASHILFVVNPSADTEDAVYSNAMALYDKAVEAGLDEAAKEMGFEVGHTDEFTRKSSYLNDLGNQKNLVALAFSNDVGTLLEPIEDEQGNFIVAKVSFEKGKHYQELKDVENRVKSRIERDKKIEMSHENGRKFLEANQPDNYLSAAEAAGGEIIEENEVNIKKRIKQIGLDEDFNRAIQETEEGAWTKLIEGKRGAYIAKVTKVYPANMEDFENDKDVLREALIEEKGADYYTEWLDEKKSKLRVKDNRAKFYAVFNEEEETEPAEMAEQTESK